MMTARRNRARPESYRYAPVPARSTHASNKGAAATHVAVATVATAEAKLAVPAFRAVGADARASARRAVRQPATMRAHGSATAVPAKVRLAPVNAHLAPAAAADAAIFALTVFAQPPAVDTPLRRRSVDTRDARVAKHAVPFLLPVDAVCLAGALSTPGLCAPVCAEVSATALAAVLSSILVRARAVPTASLTVVTLATVDAARVHRAPHTSALAAPRTLPTMGAYLSPATRRTCTATAVV